MNAYLALLLDAYRELNAKRLFWIAMVISCVGVLAFAAVGLNPNGVTIFGHETPLEFTSNMVTPASFYKLLFVSLGLNLWLGWAARSWPSSPRPACSRIFWSPAQLICISPARSPGCGCFS